MPKPFSTPNLMSWVLFLFSVIFIFTVMILINLCIYITVLAEVPARVGLQMNENVYTENSGKLDG